MMPHCPLYPPREWAEKYPINSEQLPEVGDVSSYPEHIRRRIRGHVSLGADAGRFHRAGYHGCLAFVDTLVGSVYDALAELDLIDNTIVVYTSDHGEMDGDHGIFQKFCMFEPSLKVPLIVSYPPEIPAGLVSDSLTEYIGIYHTVSELAGLPDPSGTTIRELPGAPDHLDGRSFLDRVYDPRKEGPTAAFSEFNLRHRPNQYMIRQKRFKYIHNHGADHELYDLESDPGEFSNLVDLPELAEKQAELREKLFAWYDPKTNPFLQ